MLDEAELSRVYDAHANALFGYLLNLSRSESDSRDLLQLIFCRLATKPTLFDRVRDERSFLLRMAHHAVVDLARRRASHQSRAEAFKHSVDLFQPATDPDESVFRAELEDAMAGLPLEQRAVVHLRLWEGLTFQWIAETLGISLNTAASRYRYGLDKLRTRLRPLYDEIQ